MIKAVSLILCLLLSGMVSAQRQAFDITSFGAVGNGLTLSTAAIQRAIDSCSKSGGGTVLVPAGTFKTGTLFLRSRVNLHLSPGAVIKGSEKLSDYWAYTMPDYGRNYHGILFTDSAEQVSITGPGIIDGNNHVFFEWDKAKTIEWGGKEHTRQKEGFRAVAQGIGDGPVTPKDRPRQMVVFSRCKNVDVRDVQLLNAPFWTLHFADCDGVSVSGIRLFSGMLVPNADGIGVTSCSNVIISGCDIRAGDDAIAITGYDHHFEIPGFHGIRHVSENIIVANCNLQSNSSGIRIGFLDQNTVRNVRVDNVNITRSSRGVGIFLRDEGSLENITFSNMYIQTELHSGDWWGNGEPIHISAVRGNPAARLGKISHVQFSDIICKGENGILLYGSEESTLEDISFDNVRFELTDSRLNDVAGGNVDLRGCALPKQLFERDIPAILARHVTGLRISNLWLKWSDTRMPFFTHGIELEHFSDVIIRNFKGTASPRNSKAYRIAAFIGKGLDVDDRKGLYLKNMP